MSLAAGSTKRLPWRSLASCRRVEPLDSRCPCRKAENEFSQSYSRVEAKQGSRRSGKASGCRRQPPARGWPDAPARSSPTRLSQLSLKRVQGCIAAQQWLASLAQWCESADAARVKQQLGELLRCGSRHRDKLAVVANRARQQIANVFRWEGRMDVLSQHRPPRAWRSVVPALPCLLGADLLCWVLASHVSLPCRSPHDAHLCPRPSFSRLQVQLGAPEGSSTCRWQPCTRAAVPVPV